MAEIDPYSIILFNYIIHIFIAELVPHPYPLLIFWLAAILIIGGMIFAYGTEFVSYPRLNQRQHDKEKIL